MKLLVVLLFLVALAAAAPSEGVELLSAFDFDALGTNDEQKKEIFDCLLDAEKCGDIRTFRDSVVKVIQNKCAECNTEQKYKYDSVLKMFHDKHETVYNELMKKVETEKV